MDSPWFSQLAAWGGFYAFTGTAAATLLGLIFVVVSLGKGLVGSEHVLPVVRAFYTPVVAFFSTDIAITTVMLVPHAGPKTVAVSFAVIGVVGVIYVIRSGALTQWRTLQLSIDDLLFYSALPFLGYVALCVAAASFWNRSSYALNILAAVTTVFLLVGIRNSWDLVISIAQRSGGNG